MYYFLVYNHNARYINCHANFPIPATENGVSLKSKAHYDYEEALDHAFVCLPSECAGSKAKRGELSEMRDALMELKSNGKQFPVLIFLQGSIHLQYEQLIADWVVEEFGLILIAPATHKISNRPRYVSPASSKTYKTVHDFRRNELDHIIHHLGDLLSVDADRLLLMGLSEGAVTAGTWQGHVSARMLLAWSCEDNYFSRGHNIAGDHETTSILNIIGSKDEYFANENSLSADGGVNGHGANALANFSHAKVIIYPGGRHRVLENPNAFYDITAFLQQWQDKNLNPK